MWIIKKKQNTFTLLSLQEMKLFTITSEISALISFPFLLISAKKWVNGVLLWIGSSQQHATAQNTTKAECKQQAALAMLTKARSRVVVWNTHVSCDSSLSFLSPFLCWRTCRYWWEAINTTASPMTGLCKPWRRWADPVSACCRLHRLLNWVCFDSSRGHRKKGKPNLF